MRWIDEDTFVQYLKTFHARTLQTKEENILISPSVFDPKQSTGDGKKRGYNNIVYVRNIWLDFENGDLHPDEFPKLLPNLKMVITSSFRHTTDKPRFRVVIPTTQPVPRDAYPILFDNIAAKLEDAGYTIDRGKKTKLLDGRKAKIGSGLVQKTTHQPVLSSIPS